MNFQFNNFQKILFTLIIFCGIFGLAESSLAAEPVTYYVDDNDCSDDYAGTSSDQPLCTFTEAMTKLQAGDTLIIKAGTYNQSLNMTVSGIQTSPITIAAENDGQAVVDGQGVRLPLSINSKSYIDIEGIVFRNSSGNVTAISYSNNINMKRVSAYDAAVGNYTQFLFYYCSNILLEDCAASGEGRDLINLHGTDYGTVRRCWVRYQDSSTMSGNIVAYHANNSLFENNISTTNPNGSYLDASITVWSNTANKGNNNTFKGNVAIGGDMGVYSRANFYQLTGNSFVDNVIMDAPYQSFKNESDNNITVRNMTIKGGTSGVMFQKFGGSNTIAGTVKNSSILGSTTGMIRENSGLVTLTHSYNNISGATTCFSGTTAGTGENCNTLTPNYATVTYGTGAYLLIPTALQGQGEGGADIGAQVLYRYQDGILTSQPLWPWPMEERIKNETGISVTYSVNGGLWGGTWEATKDWNEIYGGSSDATPPAAPQGLLVQ